ncbi:DNA polymerase A [Psychrobacter phage D'Alembert]|nr:DNA polymerase A [Psychrobacter phage D'Alembert]
MAFLRIGTLKYKERGLSKNKLKGQEGIYNFDLESSGLLHHLVEQKESAKLHNVCAMELHSDKMYLLHSDTQKQRDSIQRFLDRDIVLVCHNGISYDINALKHFGYDVSKVTVVDTLALSWYLDLYRPKHGLDSYAEEAGTPKPKVDDWENLTQADYDFRVKSDVKIQTHVYNKMKSRFEELYGKMTDIEFCNHKVVKYLNFKMEQLAEQQNNRIKIDVPKTKSLIEELSVKLEDKVEALKKVMPDVPKYRVHKAPKKPYKQDGTLSAIGEKWKELTDEHGYSFDYQGEIKTIRKYEEANPNSSAQVKDWLFSLGWNPQTFKYIKEDDGSEREIPQIYVQGSGGMLCESIEELAEEIPDVKELTSMGVLQHRIGVLNGFLDSLIFGQYVEAGAAGFTNTLRLKHRRPICNLPSNSVLYGSDVRSCMIAREGKVYLGSDLSALENVIKFNLQLPHDRSYVESQLSDDFDPHLDIAVEAGMLSQSQVDFYKIEKEGFDKGNYEITAELEELLSRGLIEKKAELSRISTVRKSGKLSNYACQYNAGAATVSRGAKVSMKVANKLVKAYRKRNWSLEAIAKEQKVKRTSYGKYQLNPFNGIWYNLKVDRDSVSTLIQGSGSYVLDLWLAYVFALRNNDKYNLSKSANLLANVHDEMILEILQGDEKGAEQLVLDALHKVNQNMKLEISFGCDIQFGKNYSEIH